MAAVRASRAAPSFAASRCRSRSTGRRSTGCSTSRSRPTRKRRIISPRAPSRSTTSRRPKTSSSTPSGASSTSSSSRATRASNGASTRRELDKSVTARIPTRTNTDDRYFTDTFQAMPKRRLHRDVRADARQSADRGPHRGRFSRRSRRGRSADHIIYTGPIDEYFDFRFGKLPYRSLKFDHQTLEEERHQPVGTVNYPSPDVPYTRISEYKHLTGQEAPVTTITYEYPSAEGDPYYPIPRAGESGAVQALRGACRRDRGRHLRRPPRDLPLLQYGPDRRPGARDLPADRRAARQARPQPAAVAAE